MTLLRAFTSWAVDYQGSTRSAALLRIGLVFLIWARFGYVMLPLHDLHLLDALFRVFYFVVTLMMAVGYKTRFACAASAVALGVIYHYYGIVLGNALWSAHHIYVLFVATCFIALTPCGRSYSLDRWLALKKAHASDTKAPREWGNLLGLRLIALQVSMIYFWGAADKLSPAFLNGERLQHFFYAFYPGVDFAAWPGFAWVCAAAAVGVVLLEITLSFGLHLASTRRWLLPVGVALHLSFYLIFPVLTFSLTMILLYLAVVPSDTIDRELYTLHAGTYPTEEVRYV